MFMPSMMEASPSMHASSTTMAAPPFSGTNSSPTSVRHMEPAQSTASVQILPPPFGMPASSGLPSPSTLHDASALFSMRMESAPTSHTYRMAPFTPSSQAPLVLPSPAMSEGGGSSAFPDFTSNSTALSSAFVAANDALQTQSSLFSQQTQTQDVSSLPSDVILSPQLAATAPTSSAVPRISPRSADRAETTAVSATAPTALKIHTPGGNTGTASAADTARVGSATCSTATVSVNMVDGDASGAEADL
ncbi:hypothetical protein EON62_04915 [archaeon]|nr:MAG: hypothetical protein EON62_04915 [archaeon]